jgi:hypothetical protein
VSPRNPAQRLGSREEIIRDILGLLNIPEEIGSIHVRSVSSPWDEKIRLKKSEKHRGGGLNLSLWDGEELLYGRIYRLLLYVYDALNPRFLYRSEEIPRDSGEPKFREIYNHIWSISVDSRIERLGIDNFFDRPLRRNLFIDVLRNLPWNVSGKMFDTLWERGNTTHPEIISRARDLLELDGRNGNSDAFEIEMSRSASLSAHDHIDKIISSRLRRAAEELLYFTRFHCKGTLIESSYYGIYFMRHQEIFAEMVTTKNDVLLLTLFDFETNVQDTFSIPEGLNDLEPIRQRIMEIYNKINSHATLQTMKNPYIDPIRP